MTVATTLLDREAGGLLDPGAIGVIALDASDSIQFVNAPAAALLGRAPDELIGRKLPQLVRAPGATSGVTSLTRQLRDGDTWAGVLEAAQPGGTSTLLDAAMSTFAGPGEPGVVLVIIDPNTSAFGPLGWLALHDPLTGLPNRALLADRLSLAVADIARRGGYVAALFIDLDDFKSVNDVLGHAEGDRVLTLVAERLRELLRPTDTLARYGGDELVAACQVATLGDLRDIADRLAEQTVVEVTPGWEMRVSVGAAVCSGARPDLQDLVHRADLAMYRAKASGHVEIDLTVG